MFVGTELRFRMIWRFAKWNLVRTLLISLLAVVLFTYAEWHFVAIPFLPIGTIGTAVAFYVGFKNNQAYDRLWEARRLWGGITNSSRQWCSNLICFLGKNDQTRSLVKKHIAYINVLRLQLRRTIPWATSRENLHRKPIENKKELQQYEDGLKEMLVSCQREDLFEELKAKSNVASLLLAKQIEHLKALQKEGRLTEFELSDLVKILNEFYALQGACERIKSTPLFRQYSLFSRLFVNLFILLLPFGLLAELNKLASWGVWLTIPFSMLISWVFFTMEQIGEYSENPFDNGINDTPISTICRSIEIDCLEMLGEKTPEKIQPQNGILL